MVNFSPTGGLVKTVLYDANGNALSSGVSALPVQGADANDAPVAANPLLLGAEARTSLGGAVSNGDVRRLFSTVVGALITYPYTIPQQAWAYAAANLGIVNTTTAVTIKAAAGASLKNYITAIQLAAEALGTATEVAVRDGAGGAVLWRTKIGTGGLAGLSITFPVPIVGTANTLLEVITLTASGTGAVYFNAQGFVGP